MVALDGLFSSFWKQEVPGEGADEEGAGPVGSCLGEGVVPSYQGVGVSSLEVVADLQHFSKISIPFSKIFIGFKVCNNDQGRSRQHFSEFFHVPYMGGGGPLIPWGGLHPGGGLIPGGGGGIPIPGTPGGGGICEPVKYIIIIITYQNTFFNYQVMKSNKRLVLLSSITKRENLKFPFAF